ncbi:TPA: DNA-binding protein [Yersinia enterocolitica]|nr:DNA-binding protein [Yersinia enterocolitica]
MNNIVIFKSYSDLDAERNVHDFNNFCRNKLTVFGADLKWDCPVWKGIAVFRKLDTGRGVLKDEYLLDKNFVNFARSYIRYQQALSPVKNPGTTMMALKCLEKALLQVCQSAYVYNTSVVVLDEALQIAGQHYENNVLYMCAYELEKLGKFLSEQHFLKCGFLSWTNPVKRNTKNNYVPEKEDADRKNKLPDQQALLAIAEIFSLPDEELSERDLFTTSVFALLMCAPSRASEILALPADCEITRNDKNGIERYGLRFFSVKGYGATIKWIPDVMVPVARRAISRLRRLSENARSLAKWYESSPDKFYRHELCPAVQEDKPLDVVQLCHALGYQLNDKKQCIDKVKRTSIDGGVSFLNPADGAYTLRALSKMVVGLLPEKFPWFDEDKSVKCSNALCLLNLHQCNERRLTVFYALYRPTYGFFTQDIEKARKTGQTMKNVFSRFGYLDDSGEALYLRSHQPRHLLNTLAHLGDLSELEIAKWSGRVSITQNRVYNHVSQEEMLEKVGSLKLGNNRYCGQVGTHLSEKIFDELDHGAVHLTANGYCVHDYIIPPCKKLSKTATLGWAGYDAMSEKQQAQSIKTIRSLHQKAIQAVGDGFYGAEEWVQHHEEILSILDKKMQ